MSTTPAISPPAALADLYTFNLSAFDLRLPLISAAAVALCLIVGIAVGHPGGALISAGGAFTIGFGANQRIADSRLLPIIFAILGTSSATLAGTLIGHQGLLIILFSAVAAAIYGVLSLGNAGLAWVGQQAAVALFISSAFPANTGHSFTRAALIAAGSILQLLITTVGLRLIPELRKDIRTINRALHTTFYQQRHELLTRLRQLPQALPAPERQAALIYAVRLILTVTLASELYRRLEIQSGYWVPMTALLVQKPAFFETFTRGLLRVAGTLAGADLATHLAAHMHLAVRLDMEPNWIFAVLTTLFAFGAFSTISVNYGLYSVCLTSYIVFLLSLNQIPGPEIAHRRVWCTAAGAAIAFIIHLDALRPHRIPPA